MTKTLTVLDQAQKLQGEIVDLRRHIHANPELSFEEHNTAKLTAEKLKSLGYAVKTGIAKTGVVADLGTGKIVAIRADMDGLPIAEANNVPYKSTKTGVMHACGHDAHVSIALAAAKLLTSASAAGQIRMIMQPAEENVDGEGKSGAYRMVEQGVMEGVSSVIGLHLDASLPAGKVAIMPGPVMAAADVFKITISGPGGHGAYPASTVDTVVIGSYVVQAIQQIVSRRIPAVEPAVVTIGSFQSSSQRGNVISERVTLLGTMRSFSENTRKKLIEGLESACSVARVLGADCHIAYEFGYPVTTNDPATAEIMRGAAVDLLGPDNVVTIPPITMAEDFSMLAQVAPGAFMFLGVEIAGDRRSHHSPTFDIDESKLYIGAAVLAETARRLLQQN